jgi:hypothetical protein
VYIDTSETPVAKDEQYLHKRKINEDYERRRCLLHYVVHDTAAKGAECTLGLKFNLLDDAWDGEDVQQIK